MDVIDLRSSFLSPHPNARVSNSSERVRYTAKPFVVGSVAPKKPKLELRYVIPHQFVSLCAMLLLVTHTTIPRMSRACIHLGMHDNHVSNGTCHESVDLAYQHVAK